MAANATFALKAGEWFRRGRLLIVSPDSRGTACPLSGRNSTYRLVQILEAGSGLELRNRLSVHASRSLAGLHTLEGFPDFPLGDLERLCLVHGLLPFPVGQWPKLNNATPSLRPHYRTFDATAGCSAPAFRVGTRRRRDETQVLTFHT